MTRGPSPVDSGAVKISIVIATYNAARVVRGAIESVLTQSHKNLELIIVDGGSTDGTPDIVAKHAGGSCRFICEPDRGIYDAWNKGIRLSTGDWIGFLGADDRFFPGALVNYAGIIASSQDIQYISSEVLLIDESGNSRIIGRPWDWKRFSRYMSVAHVGSLHSRALFLKYGLYNDSFHVSGDYEFLLRAGSTLKAAFVAQPLATMRTGGVSSSSASVLSETYTAKKLHGIGAPRALLDLLIAYVKWTVRRRFRMV